MKRIDKYKLKKNKKKSHILELSQGNNSYTNYGIPAGNSITNSFDALNIQRPENWNSSMHSTSF